ncbi:protein TRIGALACTOSYLDIACYLGLYCEROL 5, chloroplastic-like isoform X2 [Impatiens glandulifera]|uniref:protein TRIGALACTOSYLDIACYLGLYCEROL 5, chloroplastic-like isoform X2 n=1 Tax=Impatiens glandulifera TaxID=253017 RepID=UPI001FB110FE|nr:protein TRIGALACTOSYLDIACYLGLYCEROL 5, chloroplastic-like isoform X2 [Impatiens glandulifera]
MMTKVRRNEKKDFLWKLPVLKSERLGKLGPALGIGAGCGFGFAIGLLGGFGLGISGLQFGFGIGSGCGVGLGFGYGFGKGVAYDDRKRYSNVGEFSKSASKSTRTFPSSQDELNDVLDDLVVNSKKLLEETSREIDKWRK